MTSGDVQALRREIAALRDSSDRRERELGRLLRGVATGTPGALAALSNWLQTTEGVTARLAGIALGAIARGGVKATLAPTFRVDRPRFSLGGLHFGTNPRNVSLGGVRINVWGATKPVPTGLRRHTERFYADQSFRYGGARLTETARQRLVFLRRRLTRDPEAVRRIHGFTDYIGRRAGNRALSLRRANSVKKVLVAGVSLPRAVMHVVPHGEPDAMAATWADPWRAYDRRVEVTILRERGSRGRRR